jgi:hypothetical protein
MKDKVKVMEPSQASGYLINTSTAIKIKESINTTVDIVQKKRLIEEAHKRNLTLKEYLKLLTDTL